MTGTRQRERLDQDPARPQDSRHVHRKRTKADYLDTALTLANKQAGLGSTPYAYAMAHVDVAQVAELAGVTRTALYRLWDTQEAFRADLAAYLATTDDAPWMAWDLWPDQEALRVDPRPLLRAGLAGYPNATPVTAVLAERERSRLARHAELVDGALWSAGRRCIGGLTPHDISLVTVCMAEGLALAARLTPPRDLPLVVGHESGRPGSLFGLAFRALFDGLSQPDPMARRLPRAEARPPANAWPPSPPVQLMGRRLTGRRLHYLRLAAELAGAEPSRVTPPDGCALGYVSLDTIARATGVTRAAVRKLWPTQAQFCLALFGHLLRRDREAIVGRLEGVVPGAAGRRAADVLRQAGDGLFALVQQDLAGVSPLSFAPQLTLPVFRAEIHPHVDPLLETAAATLAELLSAIGRRPRPGITERRLAVLVLALVDGMTRVARTLPEVAASPPPDRGRPSSLLAVAVEKLLLGLSDPIVPPAPTAGDSVP